MLVQESKHAKKPHTTKPCAAKLEVEEKPLIVLSSSLPGNFFAEKALIPLCLLRNNGKIITTALLNTKATEYFFVDPAMAHRICDELQIEPIRFSKPKTIHGFDGKQALSIAHAIYPTLTVQDHRKTTTSMLMTKLGQHQIILGKP